MDLVDTLKADSHVLQGVEEAHELLHGRVELADDVLHSQHHAERHLSVDDGSGGHDGDDDVLHLVDEDAPGLLRLLQLERLHLYGEEVGLRVLPLPAAALLTVL